MLNTPSKHRPHVAPLQTRQFSDVELAASQLMSHEQSEQQRQDCKSQNFLNSQRRLKQAQQRRDCLWQLGYLVLVLTTLFLGMFVAQLFLHFVLGIGQRVVAERGSPGGGSSSLLRAFSRVELDRTLYQQVQASLEGFAKQHPDQECFSSNVVNEYRSITMFRVVDSDDSLFFLRKDDELQDKEKDPAISSQRANQARLSKHFKTFINIQVWLASELDSATLKAPVDFHTTNPRAQWPPVSRPFEEILGGCDAPGQSFADAAWWSWFGWHVTSWQLWTYVSWLGKENLLPEQDRVYHSLRDSSVFVSWFDPITTQRHEAWVSGRLAICLQHTRDLDAGLFTCNRLAQHGLNTSMLEVAFQNQPESLRQKEDL